MVNWLKNLFSSKEDEVKKIGNVLSLFDGMSCGQIALNKLGIQYENFYASEIDKHAIKVTQHNFPNTIQIGDVTKIKGEDLPKIDLLIGGSPCQGFSFSGKGLNFEDPRSKLFFQFLSLDISLGLARFRPFGLDISQININSSNKHSSYMSKVSYVVGRVRLDSSHKFN